MSNVVAPTTCVASNVRRKKEKWLLVSMGKVLWDYDDPVRACIVHEQHRKHKLQETLKVVSQSRGTATS